jgi:hypothetical protein
VWLAWDDRCLYFAVRCTEPQLDAMHLKAQKRDDRMNKDDAFEFFVAGDPTAKTYYQIIVNAAGVVFDGRGKDHAWNGDFAVATGRQTGAWTIEMAVPWATIDVKTPAPDAVIRVLFARNRAVEKPSELSTWPFAAGGNHQPQLFGRAILSGAGE